MLQGAQLSTAWSVRESGFSLGFRVLGLKKARRVKVGSSCLVVTSGTLANSLGNYHMQHELAHVLPCLSLLLPLSV